MKLSATKSDRRASIRRLSGADIEKSREQSLKTSDEPLVPTLTLSNQNSIAKMELWKKQKPSWDQMI